MKRGGFQVTPEFQAVINSAQDDLWNAWKRAENFDHRGIKGSEREEAVRNFLRERLPRSFSVTQGEVVDFRGHHSTQLDVIVYDSQRNCPLLAKTEQSLLPAEALLSVIEVKSILTANELDACYKAAAKIRSLKPFKGKFVGARDGGEPVQEHECRYFHTIFAYDTNLNGKDWLNREWERIQEAANKAKVKPDVIERIIVLNRGIINTASKTGLVTDENENTILRQWFIHLVNFLMRENNRRPPVDWLSYTYRVEKGWQKLGQHPSP
jgi:hypothetical protein